MSLPCPPDSIQELFYVASLLIRNDPPSPLAHKFFSFTATSNNSSMGTSLYDRPFDCFIFWTPGELSMELMLAVYCSYFSHPCVYNPKARMLPLEPHEAQ